MSFGVTFRAAKPIVSQMEINLYERINSFRHAFRGIGTVIRTQHNAWIHLAATVGVVALGFCESLSDMEWCVIVLAIGLVWVTEALNTAIEFLADEVSRERREGIGRAKDAGAGAVLLAAICSTALGLLVFVPHFVR
jgi:diacylglycerol kinase (ATP)